MELSELFAELAIGVIYVTHDQSEALALADQVVVMDAGRVVQTGSPQQVWSNPADPFVARFLGLSNLFEASVGDGRADLGWTVLDVAEVGGPSSAGGQDSTGREATIMVRPEAVAWTGAGTGPGERAVDGPGGETIGPHVEGVFEATVEAVAFRGDHTQVWLAVAPGVRLESRRAGAWRPAVGSTLQVAIEPGGVQTIG